MDDKITTEIMRQTAQDPALLFGFIADKPLKHQGSEWLAFCSRCNADHPTVRIGDAGSDGAGLWICDHCAARSENVSGGNVFHFAEREWGCTFPEAKDRLAEFLRLDGDSRPASKRREKANVPRYADGEPTYLYRNEEGAVLFGVYRKPGKLPGKKTFPQARPDGNGRWILGIKGVRRVLYRLPEVSAAVRAGELIFVTEGEKDCDNLAALGLSGTTSPMGARKWNQPEYAEALRGADCIILPDNDAEGQAHAAQVCESLQGIAGRVRILDLPNLPPEGGDVSDWIAAGGTLEELLALAEAAPDWQPSDPAEESSADEAAGGEILAVCPASKTATLVGETRWLWRDWVSFGHLTILAGEPGVGKSSLALHLCDLALRGKPWPDGAPSEGALGEVLFCDSEGAQGVNLERMARWGVPAERVLFPGVEGLDRLLLSDRRVLAAVERLVATRGVKLLVVDSLRASLEAGIDENSSSLAAVLAPWAELARDNGLALVIVHHFGKARQGEPSSTSIDRLRGSSAIAATARVIIALDRPDPEAEAARLAVIKSNLAKMPKALGFTISEEGIDFRHEAPRAPRGDSAIAKAEEFLRVTLQSAPMRWRDLERIASDARVSRNSLYGARENIGIVAVPDPDDPSGRGRLWSLPAREESSQRP
jgi:hypothetical protein